MVSVNRNIVRYDKYLLVITVVLDFLSVIVIAIVISLEHCTVAQSSRSSTLCILFSEKKFNRTQSVPMKILQRIFIMPTADGFNGSGRELNR